VTREERQASLARRIVWLDGNRSWFALLAVVFAVGVTLLADPRGDDGASTLAGAVCGPWLLTQIVCMALRWVWRRRFARLAATMPRATLVPDRVR